ncbi:hypothetical protein FEM48_Zijuj08G0184900 [Ziziphus jujuba var. spinosa]|uniref:Bulb-type lectin domain-containing protein n=1 Tax=Ziziphus jujuba var. spinosa TaxID=714518 RepID=A0A978V0N8_ZIZJJ|nr:hypothetical protein FEM48_Zijuj08G0184900 [Ziziphus jujuba var. spinosa]
MASNYIAFVLFLLPLLFAGEAAHQKNSIPSIIPGSIISPRTHHKISWPSPSGQFEFGFYAYGHGFAIGIWLVGNNNRNTVIWTANPDDPPVASNAVLAFNQNGLLLIEAEQEKLIANSSLSLTSASMLDSGNFVLYDDSHIAWQSFEHPTDTILGGQVLSAGDRLLSGLSETNHSSGRFQLIMQSDGNLVLYTANNIEDTSKVPYWSSGTHFEQSTNFTYRLFLDSISGVLHIDVENTPSGTQILSIWNAGGVANSTDHNRNGTIYRATLGPNGMLRLYSHDNGDEYGKPKEDYLIWSALRYACDVNFCGFNSFCTTLEGQQPTCRCVPGSVFVDLNEKTHGCFKDYRDGCRDGKENITLYSIDQIENITWYGIAYNEARMSMEECKNSCLEDCYCGAALYQKDKYKSYNVCLKHKLPLEKNLKVDVENVEEIVLYSWVYRCFVHRDLDKLVVGEDVDRKTLENMVKVGLWCIQDEPFLRPSMKSVVLMLEGFTDIASPPCPTSASVCELRRSM